MGHGSELRARLGLISQATTENPAVAPNHVEEVVILAKKLAVWQAGVAAMAASAVWAVLFFADPAKLFFLPSCPFHTLTGLYCPGCGATRAMHQLAHGNFGVALRLNALAVCGLPLVILFALRRKPAQLPGWTQWTMLWAILLFGVLRNIPIYPFRFLAP